MKSLNFNSIPHFVYKVSKPETRSEVAAAAKPPSSSSSSSSSKTPPKPATPAQISLVLQRTLLVTLKPVSGTQITDMCGLGHSPPRPVRRA
jgi:hypothetical protein